MMIVLTKCHSIFCVVLIVVTWHISEAFATSSFRLPVRGGATRHNVIATLERNGMYLDSNNNDDDDDDKNNNINKDLLMKNLIMTAKATAFEEFKSNGVQQPTSSSSAAASSSGATFIADTALPSDLGVNLRLRAYRANVPSENGYIGNEPCVIYSADKPPFGIDDTHWREHVPIRVHDQCLTSEVFGSRRCDCREQLVYALQYVSKNGGAVIYLQQEGRGIGLANKVAAYALQDQGMDTVDANVHLGFPPDARQYGVIPSILQDLKIQSIRLMTNNPRKTDRLSSLGVQVYDTIPMVVPNVINEYNRRYMETKKRRMNHQNFGDILRQDLLVTTNMGDKQVDKDDISNTITETIATTTATTTTTPSLEGVSAQDDGYCFGKQSVLDAIAAIARGDMVCVVDDMDRENEGDFIMAADLCTPQAMATIIRYSSGVICIAMEGKRMDELGLPPMVMNNEDPKGTAFSISVDATKEHGITTGISARDRSITVQLLADPTSSAIDFHRPGHIFPLRAKSGGVLERDGHTEATIDLTRLAGRQPCGILCEIVSEENPTEMARLPELIRFCQQHSLVLTSIVDLQQYRRETENETQI